VLRPGGTGRGWPGTDKKDRFPEGLIMLKLVLIDVAVAAALILVAFCAGMLRWRRRRERGLLRRTRRGSAAGSAGGRAARREAPLVPGFSADGGARGRVAAVSVAPDQRARPHTRRRRPAPDPAGRAAKGPASGWPAPGHALREVSHEPRPHRPVSGIGPGESSQDPGPADSGDEPDQQAAGPLTSSEKISSYYDEADRDMSDYLTERGWPKEPEKPGSG